MNFVAKVILAIVFEIFFKFVALGILVIDGRSGNVALIGGRLVADDGILQVI